MKVVIDTNSLLSLVRYYLPFDKNGVLYVFFKKKIETGDIIIIDLVLQECEFIAKGIVLKTLEYLNDKAFRKAAKSPFKTDVMLAPSPAKFIRQVENQFVNTMVKRNRKLSETEFENQKNAFLNSTDIKLIILCLNLLQEGEYVVLVTEEIDSSNDNKLFMKIPAMCRELGVQSMTLPELLNIYEDIDLDFK